ncbi:MAG: ribonuclease Z [Fusicatenibacter sp.]|nr:ribonuclease Z [Lachnospiraceae bacterium]MDY2937139.1 ribonuclease Z [Fusicatenibacter sp.]
MIAIVCLDDREGMMFQHRRVSSDRTVIAKVEELCQNRTLWIHPCSQGLFAFPVQMDEAFLSKAAQGDFCFVENQSLKPYEDSIESLIIFWWNRKYPADVHLGLDLKEWKRIATEEFAGYSHEKITKEVYQR